MSSIISNVLTTLRLDTSTIWKLLAVFFALLNLKNFPFAWHLRILTGLLTHLPLTTSRLIHRRTLTPSHLFRPLILRSRAQPLEIDYNFHKSNSTYFSDFDIARLHLMVRLCSVGLARTSDELWLADQKKGPRRVRIMMGGVSCNFRREIKPFQGFEMWTRILCWDRKWVYIVGFFVERGVGAEGTRGGRKEKLSGGRKGGEGMSKEEEKKKGSHPAIFATGLAKYVCKRGRITVSPERILQASGLLPPKPKDRETPPTTDSPAGPVEGDAIPMNAAPTSLSQDMTSTAAEDLIDAALNVKPFGEGDWDWEKVERERQRGMKIAEAWARTEELGEEFWVGEGEALGRWWDFPG
ncbi:MAG: hypothetical protein Q9170_001615 [Blastenia crenularia]